MNSITFNSTEIQQSLGNGLIRVFVSDGLNTAFADVSELTPLDAQFPGPDAIDTLEITKNVNLNKVVTLDIDKDVNVNVNNPDQLATAESDAEAFGRQALAETDAYTSVTENEAFSYAESTAALDLVPPDELLIGNDFVFVIDVSLSTEDPSPGLTIPVGDLNNDGLFNTILDVEIASFMALNQQLIDDPLLRDTAKVSIVSFSSTATRQDMSPDLPTGELGKPGFQSFTSPIADDNRNSIPDVVDVLMSLVPIEATNYRDALTEAGKAVTAAGTAVGDGSVIFLSDGVPSVGIPDTGPEIYGPIADSIRDVQGQNLRAFGVGAEADVDFLKPIDPNAAVFTDPDNLLALFCGGTCP